MKSQSPLPATQIPFPEASAILFRKQVLIVIFIYLFFLVTPTACRSSGARDQTLAMAVPGAIAVTTPNP